nr:MAG TPA: YtxH-like protein [Caudoviricetes sp.]
MLFELAKTSSWYAYWLGVAVGVAACAVIAVVFSIMHD